MNSLVNVLVTALVFSVGVQTQYTKSELDIAEEMLKDIGLHKKPDLKQVSYHLELYKYLKNHLNHLNHFVRQCLMQKNQYFFNLL